MSDGMLNLSVRSDRELIAARFCERLAETGIESTVLEPAKCLSYLDEATASESVKLFASYIWWCRSRTPYGDPSILQSMYLLREVVNSCVEPACRAGAISAIDAAIDGITSAVRGSARQITVESLYKELASEYLAALLSGDRHKAQRLIHSAVESGTSIRDIYLQVFQPAQHEVGHLWQTNRISVADEHFCTAATQSIMIDLYPKIISSHRIGKILVAACVGSELHEIGIRMVADFFEMEGWDTYYLGAGTRHEEIIAAVAERKADLLALSATMTYHVDEVRSLIRLIRTRGAMRNLRIMVGGLPFNSAPNLWQEVGADIWAPDAEQALKIISQDSPRET